MQHSLLAGAIFFAACMVGAGVVLTGCGQQNTYVKNSTHQTTPDESILHGEKLATQYCRSCHMLPAPGLLSAKVWEDGVLPQMGPRLGIFEYKYKRYPSVINDAHVGRRYYPMQPVISLDDWQSIIDYYTALSPDTLHIETQPPAQDGSALFQAVMPALHYYSPATSLIKADTASKTFLTSDIDKRITYRFNSNLQLADSLLPNKVVTDVLLNKDTVAVCNMGLFSPNNAQAGSLEMIIGHANPFTLADTLLRPVSIAAADFNNDGKTDYVTCEFGYVKGELSWQENKGNNVFIKHIIKAVPGAIKAYTNDYNHDGLPDIWVLFAQGDEGIYLYTNKGNGNFEERPVLRFPPCYGSSYFELTDINKDGHPDIVYTCGDNADYSTILKPYHGVYVFVNDGSNNFKQQYFYHINGCYKAVACDFNGDGHIDIAAIAYFADYAHRPSEGFVYLQGKSGLSYMPYSLPATNTGRWITMDVADITGDGKPDILLANCSIGPSINKSSFDWKKGPPFMVLKNMAK